MEQNQAAGGIGLDKSGYQVNIFLIFPGKYIIYCGYSLEVPH